MKTEESWVLLVEDTAEDRELAVHALRRADFRGRVEEARDGVEALDRLHCREQWSGRDPLDLPRAVFLDIKMPRVDGVEVLRQLKQTPHLAHVPVVMLTSSAEESDLRTCYALGANSYVVKPVDFDDYLACIGDVGRYWVVRNQNPTEPLHEHATPPGTERSEVAR